MLTAARLRKILDYDPLTGVFRWKVRRGPIMAGVAAGTMRPNGDIRILVDGKGYYAHRLAWLYVHGRWPKEQVDHINRDRSDNSLGNLREAAHGQNRANSIKNRNNKSGYKGVCYRPNLGLWVAQITHKKTVIYLGCFDSPQKAHVAYVGAASRLHGEFARSA